MYQLFTTSTVLVAIWIMVCGSAIFHQQIEAAYGDACTMNDTSNCTKPQLTCLPSEICGCSQGYVIDTSQHNETCRLPAYNESCDGTVGCQPYLQCENTTGTLTCTCEQDIDYYNSSSGQCVEKPYYGENCDVNIGCVVYNQCYGTPPICQCNASDLFFDSTNYQCMQISGLKVNILSTIISPTTVTFTWDAYNPDIDVMYKMSWTPNDGKLDNIYEDGGQASGLRPHTLYNFTITTVLQGGPGFPERSVSAVLPPIQTMAVDDSSHDSLGLGLGLGLGGAVVLLVVVGGSVFYRKRRSRGIEDVTKLVSAEDRTSGSRQAEASGFHPRSDNSSHNDGYTETSRISYGTLPLGALEDDDNVTSVHGTLGKKTSFNF